MKRNKWIAVLTAACGATLFAAALAGCTPNEPEIQKWTVTFESNGGTAIEPVEVEDGGKVAKPADPSKTDCDFDKWYSDEELKTEWSFENGIILSDKTLYAGWLDARPVATFDSDGGTETASVRFSSGSKITEPQAPVRNGYDFDGWYSGAKKWDFSSDTSNSDIALTAKWNKKQNLKVTKETALDLSQGQYNIVSYDGAWIDGMNVENYGEVSITLVYQAEIPGDYGLYISAAKEWNDAKLSAFNVEVNGEKQATVRLAPSGDWNTALNSNIVKVAFRQGMNTVRLTVDTALATDKLDAAEKIKSVTVLDAYPEYTYMPAANGGAYFYKDDIISTAQFGGKYENAYRSESAEDAFSITLNADRAGNYDISAYAARPQDAGEAALWVSVNGTDVYETLYISNLANQTDRTSSFKTQPVLNVALAVGENIITFAYADGSDISAENYTELMWLSAKYSDNQSEKVLVTFEGEGVEMRPVSLNAGGTFAKPADPSVEGKFFTGWFVGEEKYDFTKPVTQNLTLTAKYGSSVTVTFVGEPNVQSAEVAIGQQLDKDALEFDKKAGYTVAYWADAAMTQRFDFSAEITEPITVYASYEAIVYEPVTSVKLDWATAEFENVSYDGEKVDWGQDNGSVTFKFTAETAGEYGMCLEYARDIGWNGGSYRRPQYCVTVNGTEASQRFTLTPTTGWGDVCYGNVIALNLNAGENAIVLSTAVKENNLEFLAHIKNAYILDRYPEYGIMPQNVHAASGVLNGCNSQYGGKFVDFNNQNASVEVEISAIAGDYNLALMYAGDFTGTPVVEIFVNGASVATLQITSTGSRDTFGLSDTAAIALVSGANTVKLVLSTPLESGNFDLSALRITVPADAER